MLLKSPKAMSFPGTQSIWSLATQSCEESALELVVKKGGISV